MKKWDYKILKYDSKGWAGGKIQDDKIEYDLCRLGDEGWELINAFDTNATYGVSRLYVFMLKRPKD